MTENVSLYQIDIGDTILSTVKLKGGKGSEESINSDH